MLLIRVVAYSHPTSEKELECRGYGMGACFVSAFNTGVGKVALRFRLLCAVAASRSFRPWLCFFVVLVALVFWFREALQSLFDVVRNVHSAKQKRS
jgi:hypothetical protein